MTTEQRIREKIKVFRPTSQKVNLFDPNLNDKSVLLFKFKDDKDNKFKIWIFSDTIKLETPLTTSLLFSINFPDKVCLANRLLEEKSGIGKIFTDNSDDDQIQFSVNLLEDYLKSINFDSNEGLTVYGNSLQLTLKEDRQLLPEIKACDRMKSIIEFNFPGKYNEIDYSDLPVDLRQILKKFESLAIADDFERDEKIQDLTEKQRLDLIDVIERKLEDINLFLDTFGDKQLTQGAIGIQSLAEMVAELTTYREKKNHS